MSLASHGADGHDLGCLVGGGVLGAATAGGGLGGRCRLGGRCGKSVEGVAAGKSAPVQQRWGPRCARCGSQQPQGGRAKGPDTQRLERGEGAYGKSEVRPVRRRCTGPHPANTPGRTEARKATGAAPEGPSARNASDGEREERISRSTCAHLGLASRAACVACDVP